MSTDITAIGDVNVDLLSSPIPFYPRKDSKTIVPSVNLQVGGGAMNFACAVSKLGLKTRLIGLVGRDIFGDYVIGRLAESGIESKVKTTGKEKTGITLGIQFRDGSRSLISYRGTNSELSLNDFKLKDIEGRAIHIGGYNFLDKLRMDVYKIVKYAKDRGMLVSLDPDVKNGMMFELGELDKVMKFVDIFFPDKIEGSILTKERNNVRIVKKLLSFGCKIVALKCGERGCVIGEKGKILFVKGIKTKPVNPTGIGDIFNAAFVFNYLKTGDARKAGLFANAAGSLAITKRDGSKFLTEKEIERFIR